MAIFNNSQKQTEERHAATEQKISIIASGMMMEGTVESQGDIRVEGKIKGTLICKAKLVIGASGVVEGNIDALNANIAGQIEGSVLVRDVLQVQETARINGDVCTEKMNMQTGGLVTGQIKMGKEAKEILQTKVPSKAPASSNGAAQAPAKETSAAVAPPNAATAPNNA